MVTAFDFDGTLTDKDTLLGFFLCFETPFRTFKILLYCISMVMTKLKIISNSQLKSIGILFFLKGKPKLEIERVGEKYAETIKLNPLYFRCYVTSTNTLIISASFYEYLKFIFPEQTIIASQLKYDSSENVTGLKFNCYGNSKLTVIKEKKIDRIDIFYTDNPKSDKVIVDFAEKAFLVHKGFVRIS
jgi:phosphoserine phosphatase